MIATATLTMIDDVRVVVPDSLDLITPYVLLEQEDWFEDEIKFLRRLLKPGQKVIDIGANYGVYALSMAQTVGPTGRVWAFEPASSTADLLAEGIAVNGFTQIVLERSALSSTCGTAELSLNENSELNALVHGDPATSASETVPLLTLDEWMKGHGGVDIDFMTYGAQLAEPWEQTMAIGNSNEVAEALSLYALSRDSSRPASERFASLESSFRRLKTLCEHDPSYLRLASLARVAHDLGARSIAVNALQQLAKAIVEQQQVDPSEPFLAPGERFDAIPPGDAIGNWVLAGVLEELERLSSFSSFYTGVSAHQRLEIIHALGFGSAEMKRRLRLLQSRFGLPAS